MPKVTTPQELDALAALIPADLPGMGVDALAQAWQQAAGQAMSRRTLQRRLALLVYQNRVHTQGAGRALRYVLAQTDSALVLREPSPLGAADNLPLSPEGRAIQAHVRQALQKRQPVGYQTAFLEAYHPNVTAYLPPDLRAQLRSMGQTPVPQAAAGTFARDMLQRLLIDLAWASSRLEGNTYSQLDTERLIGQGLAAEGKDTLEAQMILNHKDAIEFLVHDPDSAALSVDTVIALHAFLSDGLMADPLACGRVRSRSVGIGGSVYLPMSLPQRLQDLLVIVIQMACEIEDPFEQAFFLMVHLPYLQPFEDVNKRVSRLAANIPFIRHNLCPLSFIDVPQQTYIDGLLGVYELNRVELLRDVFVWAYERSCQQYVAVQQNLKTPDLFRLRHRQALYKVVAMMVQHDEPATAQAVSQHLPAMLPLTLSAEDRERFVALVLEEFKTLHAGNVIRLGLRPLEWAQWQSRHPLPL
jgi:Fic/DOC family